MRLFVAVELDDSVRKAAEQSAEELRKRVDRDLRFRWVPTSNLHLTVRFIGHVDDGAVPAVLESLAQPLATSGFDVALQGCGVFPQRGAPRAVWIGLREGLPSLRALHEEFSRRLMLLGFAPENRPFTAHLTLARVKGSPRGSMASAREAVRSVPVPDASCHVSEAVVFESRLSPKGSTYVAHLRVPLLP